MSKIEKNPVESQPGSNEATEESTDKTLTASEQQKELQRENGELKLKIEELESQVKVQQSQTEEEQPEKKTSNEERLAAIELNQELNDYKSTNNIDDQQTKRILEIVKESNVNIETAHKILVGENSLQPSDEGEGVPSPVQSTQKLGAKDVTEMTDEELRAAGNQENNQR